MIYHDSTNEQQQQQSVVGLFLYWHDDCWISIWSEKKYNLKHLKKT